MKTRKGKYVEGSVEEINTLFAGKISKPQHQAERVDDRQGGHTPTPWKVSQTGKFVMHSRPGTVLNVCEASIEDAAFIVRAVNAHEELLEALTILKDCFSDVEGERENFEATISYETLKRVEQAIAKAEGK